MTDTKALIAEARKAEDDWTLAPGEMRKLCNRLADDLERATAWRPIAEALRDGTPCLVSTLNSIFQPTIAHAETDHRTGQYVWGVLQSDMGFYILPEQPTHFLPLPAAPGDAT